MDSHQLWMSEDNLGYQSLPFPLFERRSVLFMAASALLGIWPVNVWEFLSLPISHCQSPGVIDECDHIQHDLSSDDMD